MRLFASIVWITAFSFSTLVSGILPVHGFSAAGHGVTDGVASAQQAAPQSSASARALPDGATSARQAAYGDVSPYAGYAEGYGPVPSCQIDPSLPPPNWPASATQQPFQADFSTFLGNQIKVDPNSSPVPIEISQQPSQIKSGRAINSLPLATFNVTPEPYQLLYNGQFPGPTIRVTSEQKDNSTLQLEADQMPTPPPLTQLEIANTLTGENTNVPFPYFTTHLHGGHTPPEHDGHPDDLLPPAPVRSGGAGSVYPTPSGTPTPTPGPAHLYSYTNDQQPQILWYHDHADMNTSPHVAQGLFAFYIIQEPTYDPNVPYLPYSQYDIPLGMQVQTAGNQPVPSTGLPNDPKTGQPAIPATTVPTPPATPTPQMTSVNVVTVNGVDSPKMDVEPRFYRFRMLNASAGQSVSLELCGQALGSSNYQNLNESAWLIGTDGGMLPAPVNLMERTLDPFHDKRLDLFQAERYDVLIDFSKYQNQTVYLSAIVRGPNACMAPVTTTSGAQVCWDQQMPILAFNVNLSMNGKENVDITQIGNRSWDDDTKILHDNHANKDGSFDTTPNRVFSFDHLPSAFAPPTPQPMQWAISGQLFSPFRITNGGVATNASTEASIDGKEQWTAIQFPQAINPSMIPGNAVDLWALENTVMCATHPVHVHDIEFQNVSINKVTLTDAQAREMGWKDIFVLMPKYSATSCPWAPMNGAATDEYPSISFIGQFETHWIKDTPPPSTQIGDTVPWLLESDGPYTALTSGTYVFHCHNLGHEDNMMMGQFQVLPPSLLPQSIATDAYPAPAAEGQPPGMSMGHGP